MFRYKKNIPLSYNRQGYIYFISRAYSSLDRDKQSTIKKLCEQAGGNNPEALFEFVTSDTGATAICIRHCIASKTTLDRAIKKYYLRFPDKL